MIQNLIEYYDELFPVSDSQKSYFSGLARRFTAPVKFLRVQCGTGMFESMLAKEGHDVTGIESIGEMLQSANHRRRNQLMAIRFFQMSSQDMTKFLGKGFYNIISCLDSRVIFLGGRENLEDFFRGCRRLLSPSGVFVLELLNFAKFNTEPLCKLPTRESVRSRLFSELWTDSRGRHSITLNVETGNGRLLPVLQNESVYAPSMQELCEIAEEAGFPSISCHDSFAKEAYTGTADRIVLEMS